MTPWRVGPSRLKKNEAMEATLVTRLGVATGRRGRGDPTGRSHWAAKLGDLTGRQCLGDSGTGGAKRPFKPAQPVKDRPKNSQRITQLRLWAQAWVRAWARAIHSWGRAWIRLGPTWADKAVWWDAPLANWPMATGERQGWLNTPPQGFRGHMAMVWACRGSVRGAEGPRAFWVLSGFFPGDVSVQGEV